MNRIERAQALFGIGCNVPTPKDLHQATVEKCCVPHCLHLGAEAVRILEEMPWH